MENSAAIVIQKTAIGEAFLISFRRARTLRNLLKYVSDALEEFFFLTKISDDIRVSIIERRRSMNLENDWLVMERVSPLVILLTERTSGGRETRSCAGGTTRKSIRVHRETIFITSQNSVEIVKRFECKKIIGATGT